MTRHTNPRPTVSSLLGSRILGADGASLGHVQELVVAPATDPGHIKGFILRPPSPLRGKAKSFVLLADLDHAPGGFHLRSNVTPAPPPEDENLLFLERDLLDQQIIDVHGHKVVRVNDVELAWVNSEDTSQAPVLRISQVEVGVRGAIRRLLKGLPHSTVDRISCRFSPTIIPWEFVDLIERDPARRVRLTIEQDRLSQMHPSDIADILEELAPAERHALFISLDEEVAAEALEEVRPKMQQALIESLDSEQIAGIVEEMDPGAAADLLSELPEDRSEAILEEMDPDERQEVEELLEFEGDSAAGRMTTDYISLPASSTIRSAIDALREYEGDTDTLTDIYLTDDDGHISAHIPLVQLLLAANDQPLSSLPHGHLITCPTNTSGRKVAELFDKYNLRSLPVVDPEGRLAGVVHAEQVIALLRSNS